MREVGEYDNLELRLRPAIFILSTVGEVVLFSKV